MRRGAGMGGPNPIATSELLAELDLHGITDPEARLDYAAMIDVLDGIYLKDWTEKHPSSNS